MKPVVIALSLAVVAGSFACAHGVIPGTQIPNTDENRQVYDVVQNTVNAMNARNAEALIALLSPRYFEDNGTADQSDDYGYEELTSKILPESMKVAEEIQLEVEVQDIVVSDDNRAHADVRYRSRIRLKLPSRTLWDTGRDFNRIELARENGVWRIVSGL